MKQLADAIRDEWAILASFCNTFSLIIMCLIPGLLMVSFSLWQLYEGLNGRGWNTEPITFWGGLGLGVPLIFFGLGGRP